MRYLVTLAGVDPLTLHWSLYNDGAAPVYVPRLLTPLGAFVALTVRDAGGALVYQSETPKLKLKLDPRRAASYLALEGGYSYGAVFILDDLALHPGDSRLEVA